MINGDYLICVYGRGSLVGLGAERVLFCLDRVVQSHLVRQYRTIRPVGLSAWEELFSYLFGGVA